MSDGDVISRMTAAEAINEWSSIRPQIENVMAHVSSGLFPDDILTCVQTGHMQLWRIINDQGIAITEVQIFPRYAQLLVYMVAGENAKDWIAKGQQQLEAFAKSQDCKHMEFHGRPGWERYCARLGYKHKVIKMRKDL